MIKIGITGSLASGKTTASKILSFRRGPLFSADKVVKELYQNKRFKHLIERRFKLKNNNFKKISLLDEHIILNNNSDIVFFNEDKMDFKNLSIEKLFIKDFFVIDESLYIYDKDHLYKYLTLIF